MKPTESDLLEAPILIVDDQEANIQLLGQLLAREGYTRVSATMNPQEVCALHRKTPFELILLDLQMPQMDGFQVMEGLKTSQTDPYLPVIVLTAQPGHKLRALQAGARDFISKPFSPAELIARVRAVLRRVRPAFAEQVLTFHDLRLDLAAHRVFRHEREIHLSPTEFKLLCYLMSHAERVHSRAQLLDKVWGDHVFIEERTVDVHVKRLREALGAAGMLVETVRGAGYRLTARPHLAQAPAKA